MSAFGGKADITVCRCPLAVAIRGKTDIDVLRPIPSQGVIWVDNILLHSASGTMVRRREFIKIAAGAALGTCRYRHMRSRQHYRLLALSTRVQPKTTNDRWLPFSKGLKLSSWP